MRGSPEEARRAGSHARGGVVEHHGVLEDDVAARPVDGDDRGGEALRARVETKVERDHLI
jgi:hypothetical protein